MLHPFVNMEEGILFKQQLITLLVIAIFSHNDSCNCKLSQIDGGSFCEYCRKLQENDLCLHSFAGINLKLEIKISERPTSMRDAPHINLQVALCFKIFTEVNFKFNLFSSHHHGPPCSIQGINKVGLSFFAGFELLCQVHLFPLIFAGPKTSAFSSANELG